MELNSIIYRVSRNEDTDCRSVFLITEYRHTIVRNDRLVFMNKDGLDISVPPHLIDKKLNLKVRVDSNYYFSTLEGAENFISNHWAEYSEAFSWRVKNMNKIATAYNGDFKEFISSFNLDLEDYLSESVDFEETLEMEDIEESNPKYLEFNFQFVNGVTRLGLADCFLEQSVIENPNEVEMTNLTKLRVLPPAFKLVGSKYYEQDPSMYEYVNQVVDDRLISILSLNDLSFKSEMYVPISLVRHEGDFQKWFIDLMIASLDTFKKVYNTNNSIYQKLCSEFSLGYLSYLFFD